MRDCRTNRVVCGAGRLPARPPDMPNRPLRPPDKGQTGIDRPSMVNLKGQTGANALPWTTTSDCQSPRGHIGEQ
jgi:hypothetical protein